jgi:hypothetical protein
LAVGFGESWLALKDTNRPFAETAGNPTDCRKPTFGLAGSRRSLAALEIWKLSFDDDNQFFRMAVGSAALPVLEICNLPDP